MSQPPSILAQQAIKADIPPGSGPLLPALIRVENLRLLIVGGGSTGLENLQEMLRYAPTTPVRLVAPQILGAIRELAAVHRHIELVERAFLPVDLDQADLILGAVRNPAVSGPLLREARQRGKLIHIAGRPELCDFFLGSMDGEKAPIKPTPAEASGNRLHVPADLGKDILGPLQDTSELTRVLVAKQSKLQQPEKPEEKKWQQIVKWCLFAFCFMILGHGILSLVPFDRILVTVQTIPRYVDGRSFLIMLITGFLAQMVDGSLGMGYGTISTTFLLAYGVNPAIVSSRVHSARVFSSGVSGYSHHRFGNINKKLFGALVVPGALGAILGASLAYFGKAYADLVRIPLSLYTIYLGYFIIRKAFRKSRTQDRVRNAGWLAAAGGLMDAFAGGGWGALVTSTLISKRKSPRFVIGSVCLAEFFVVLASSITFFIFLKNIPLWDVAGLILGGLLAAPIAARLVGKLPLKTMFMAVGVVVILTSCTTFYRAVTHFPGSPINGFFQKHK